MSEARYEHPTGGARPRSLGDRARAAPMVAIRGITYRFPRGSASLRELAARGLLESDPVVLEGFGFGRVRVATDETPYGLARDAAAELLGVHGIDPESVGALVYAGPQGPTAFTTAPTAAESVASHRTTGRFQFPATRLQHELGLVHATAFGIDQLACTSLFCALRIARALCLVEGIERALCVASEFFPADAGREAIYNCTSDAAVAVLVERGGACNRIVAASHITKGYYWNPDALRAEVVAAYFPTAKHVIERTMARAGWTPAQVDWVIPHNMNWRSWQILLGLAGLSHARVWSRNIARDGHTLAGDNFINLADALASGGIEPGQRLLLFSYGYGAHWTALAVEA